MLLITNVFEGLNTRNCIWRLKRSTQSASIKRVFLRNVHDNTIQKSAKLASKHSIVTWLCTRSQISNMKWELNGLFADLPHYFPNVMHTSIETLPTCHNLCNGLLLLRSPQIAFMSVNNTTPLLLPLCLLIRYNCALCTCLTQPSDQVYTSNWFDASHISARVSEYIRCVVMKCWYFLNVLKLHLHAF